MEDQGFGMILLTTGSFLIGTLLGVALSKVFARSAVEEAVEEATRAFDKEKEELSGELTQHLGRFRDSIVQSVEAYEAAIKMVDDKLPLTPEQREGLLGGGQPVLQVEYKQTDQEEDIPEQLSLDEAAPQDQSEEELEELEASSLDPAEGRGIGCCGGADKVGESCCAAESEEIVPSPEKLESGDRQSKDSDADSAHPVSGTNGKGDRSSLTF